MISTEGASTTAAERIRALVIQAHRLVRQGTVGILESSGTIQVVAHTGSAQEAVRLAADFRPDVVVLDADLPGADVIGLVGALKAAQGGHVLVISEDAGQAQVERALGDGADGYTIKDVSVTDFVDTVTKVAEGELQLHPRAAAALARSFSAMQTGGRHPGEPALTQRQREIMQLLVMGLQNKQIARRLGIGVETVKTHISRILERLGVSSRTEAVVVALRDGLVA